MTTPSLRPCPFCGGAAEVEREGTPRQSAIVGCTECHCRLESNENGAGFFWNTRIQSDEDDRPYVCPGCHAVAPERCVPGCIDAEIEAELSEREHEPTESEDDEP